MAGLPHLPWYVGDFMASTQSWSGEERGLYLLALGLQWTEKCLPNDLPLLAKTLGFHGNHFNRLWKRVGTKFIEFEGTLINRRLEEHRSKAFEIQRRNTERATKAAVSRWDNPRAPSNAPSIPRPMLRALNGDAPSMSGDNAIQSNLKNKNSRYPVDSGDNSDASQRAPVGLKARRATAQAPQPEASADKAWVLLIASDGAIRPARAQAALDRIPGGWPAIRMRTPRTEDTLRAQFTAAYDDVKG